MLEDFRYVLLAAALAMLSATPALAQDSGRKLSKNEQELAHMGAEEASIHMHYDGLGDLDPTIWVSSEPFNRTTHGDKFLRAGIRKTDGNVFYQLYMKTSSSRGPARLNRLTYIVNDKLKVATIDRLNTDPDCGRYGCVYLEDAVADIPRADLEELAKPDPSDLEWRMKVFADGGDEETTILRSEIAGFLYAVDRQIARMKGN